MRYCTMAILFTCLTLITITMMEINTASSPTKGLSIAATVGV